MKTELDSAFKMNQADLTLDALTVQWAGETVVLWLAQRILTSFSTENVVMKIKRWCVKNHYRCPQIVNERVML